MVQTKIYENSLNGLQKKYERGFKNFITPELSKDDAFALSYDPMDKQDRSNIFKYLRANYNDFQAPYIAAGFELGKAFYSLQRDSQQSILDTTFDVFNGITLSKSLVDDNILPYWTLTGLLKKVKEESATLEWAASIASKGVADLARNTTIASANADSKTVKIKKIKLSTGACEFCRSIAKKEEDGFYVGYETKYSRVKMHENCNCAVVFEFSEMSASYYNNLSKSQQKRVSNILSDQNNA